MVFKELLYCLLFAMGLRLLDFIIYELDIDTGIAFMAILVELLTLFNYGKLF